MVNKGYGWNFPKADGFSLGAGVFGKQRKAQNLKLIVQDYASIFHVNLDSAPAYGHPLSLWDGVQKLHTENAILVGEAACVVDPFTAEGIRPSIFSGLKGAIAIYEARGGNINALEEYTTTMSEEWGKQMIWAQRLAQLFYSFPKLGYQIGVKRPIFMNAMVKVLCGELNYSDMAGEVISNFQKSIEMFI